MNKILSKRIGLVGIVIVFIALAVALNMGWFGRIDLKKMPGKDKAVHFVLMGLFAVGVNMCFSCSIFRVMRIPVPKGAVLAAVLVTLDEVVQIWVPGRTFSWADLAMSLAGVVVFSLLTCVIYRLMLGASDRKGCC